MLKDTKMINKCIITQPQLSAREIQTTILSYVQSELCPCALEEFNYRIEKNTDNYGYLSLEGLKDALFRGVLNEAILRVLASEIA